jgi:hypothetical protein
VYCLKCGKHQNAKICFPCRWDLFKSVWQLCTRCAKSDCLGECSDYLDLESFTVLFPLEGYFRLLLKESQQNQSFYHQEIFKVLFEKYFLFYLNKTMRKYQITDIFITPTSWQEVIKGSWHPHIWFYEVLNIPKNLRVLPSFKWMNLSSLKNLTETVPQNILILEDIFPKSEKLLNLTRKIKNQSEEIKIHYMSFFRSYHTV